MQQNEDDQAKNSNSDSSYEPSFDEDDLEELHANAVQKSNIEANNRKGCSRNVFKKINNDGTALLQPRYIFQ